MLIGRTNAEAEAPILCPPDAKSQVIGKDPDAEKDRRQKKWAAEDVMVRQHHYLNGYEFEETTESGGQEPSISPWGHKE